MAGSETVALGGREVWVFVVELDGGLRVRLDLTDWERLDLYRGQRVVVRRPGRVDESLFVAEVVEVPPVVWVVLAKRVSVATPSRSGDGTVPYGRRESGRRRV
jgi:hypothetical protein